MRIYILLIYIFYSSANAQPLKCVDLFGNNPIIHFESGMEIHRSLLKDLLEESKVHRKNNGAKKKRLLTLDEAMLIDEWMVGDLSRSEMSSKAFRDTLNRGISKLPLIDGVFYRVHESSFYFNPSDFTVGKVIKLIKPYGISVTFVEKLDQELMHGPYADFESYSLYRFEEVPTQVTNIYIRGRAHSLSEFYKGEVETSEGRYQPEVSREYTQEAEAHILPGSELIVREVIQDPITGWFNLILIMRD